MSSIYCTYLTTYFGNKLPPFYIGYSLIKNIKNNYHGTPTSKEYQKVWKQELKDHPELFKTKILTTHNDRIEVREREYKFQKSLKVVKNPLYINKSAGCHADNTGKKLPSVSLERKHKIRLSMIENKNSQNSGAPIGNKNQKRKIKLSEAGTIILFHPILNEQKEVQRNFFPSLAKKGWKKL